MSVRETWQPSLLNEIGLSRRISNNTKSLLKVFARLFKPREILADKKGKTDGEAKV